MAAAYDLKKAGHEVTIFESANYVGGLASGFKEPHWDWSVEKFYHHWFQSDSDMLGLIDELGLKDKVIFPRPFTVCTIKGNGIHLTRSSMRFVFPGLGLVSIKSNLASSDFFCVSRTTGKPWKNSPLMSGCGNRRADKSMKRCGSRCWSEVRPFYKDVNMAWMWARLKARTTRLGTFEGGFQNFADLFGEKLRARGC